MCKRILKHSEFVRTAHFLLPKHSYSFLLEGTRIERNKAPGKVCIFSDTTHLSETVRMLERSLAMGYHHLRKSCSLVVSLLFHQGEFNVTAVKTPDLVLRLDKVRPERSIYSVPTFCDEDLPLGYFSIRISLEGRYCVGRQILSSVTYTLWLPGEGLSLQDLI